MVFGTFSTAVVALFVVILARMLTALAGVVLLDALQGAYRDTVRDEDSRPGVQEANLITLASRHPESLPGASSRLLGLPCRCGGVSGVSSRASSDHSNMFVKRKMALNGTIYSHQTHMSGDRWIIANFPVFTMYERDRAKGTRRGQTNSQGSPSVPATRTWHQSAPGCWGIAWNLHRAVDRG